MKGTITIAETIIIWDGVNDEDEGKIQLVKSPQQDRSKEDSFLALKLEEYFASPLEYWPNGPSKGFSDLRRSWNAVWNYCQYLANVIEQEMTFVGKNAPAAPNIPEDEDIKY